MAAKFLKLQNWTSLNFCIKSYSLAPKNMSTYAPKGCMAAPFTPFTKDGKDVDYSKFKSYADHLQKLKIPHLFVNGTTGEGLSMTMEERIKTAELWMQQKDKFESILLHIGTGNLKDSIQLASHAESIGVDGIACIAPSFFRANNEESVVSYMKEVADAAPNTPFYLYDFNIMTNVYISVSRFFDLAKDEIKTLRGVKHSSPQLPSLFTGMREHRGYQFMMGTDDQYLAALSLGSEAIVTSAFMAPYFNKIIEAFNSGDLEAARNAQEACQKVVNVRSKYGTGPQSFAVGKSMMPMLDLDLGPVRLPLVSLTSDLAEKLQSELKAVNFFDWVKV
ncbi:unnamed protein product [Owenia fusiformis]|uniref:N-acetylneuraminate lyase n=1 Tax=Owenia fusiformis TaxID=6347 RepID=A0A8J1XZK6_OWEFU|nr:unnamed protein product [Owenia fusiformis]